MSESVQVKLKRRPGLAKDGQIFLSEQTYQMHVHLSDEQWKEMAFPEALIVYMTPASRSERP